MDEYQKMYDEAHEKRKCFMPFYGYDDLYKKCTDILSVLNEYKDNKRKELVENNIPHAESVFSFFFNWEELTTEQRKYMMDGKDWELFAKDFVEKYKIEGNLQSLNV